MFNWRLIFKILGTLLWIEAAFMSLSLVLALYHQESDIMAFTLTVGITDWGSPFDPLAQEDPERPTTAEEARIGGLGIFMVKRMCDDVSYLRDGNANVIVIRKSW